MKLPVVEKFVSIQGEGYWTGTPMAFIRLAGCSVGGGNAICKDYTGQEFPCDTNYNISKAEETYDIINWCEHGAGQHRVCLTGGEPCVHNLDELVYELWLKGFQIHIETSGTKRLPDFVYNRSVAHRVPWVTVSPKYGYLPEVIDRANEVKWLVKDVDGRGGHGEVLKFPWIKHRFVQPVWDDQYEKNLQLALQLCYGNPGLRLSVQTHKLIGVR